MSVGSFVLYALSIFFSIVYGYLLLTYVRATPEIWIMWILTYVTSILAGLVKAVEE